MSINVRLKNITFEDDFGPKTLKPGWFKANISVRYLQMQYINVFEIEDNAFSGLSFQSLLYLKLLDIPIQYLREYAFNGLENLKELYMRKLEILSIQKNILATVP